MDNAKWSGSGNKFPIKLYDPMENMSPEEKDSVKDLCHDFKYMFQKLTDKAAGTMIMEKKAVTKFSQAFSKLILTSLCQ